MKTPKAEKKEKMKSNTNVYCTTINHESNNILRSIKNYIFFSPSFTVSDDLDYLDIICVLAVILKQGIGHLPHVTISLNWIKIEPCCLVISYQTFQETRRPGDDDHQLLDELSDEGHFHAL